jgi:RNAse (barnase) inhibitor barstar
MKDLAQFLLDSVNSGVYAAPASIAALKQAAVACGLAWFEVDLTGVAGKAAFFTRCQTAFGLPPSFGHNWDALADCLADLSWQPARGYVAMCRNGKAFARDAAEESEVALDILAAAATYWQAKGKVFMALLDAETRGGRKLKPLPA